MYTKDNINGIQFYLKSEGAKGNIYLIDQNEEYTNEKGNRVSGYTNETIIHRLNNGDWIPIGEMELKYEVY